jgi:hypothetical protein
VKIYSFLIILKIIIDLLIRVFAILLIFLLFNFLTENFRAFIGCLKEFQAIFSIKKIHRKINQNQREKHNKK